MYRKIVTIIMALVWCVGITACIGETMVDTQQTEPNMEATETTEAIIPGLDQYEGDVDIDDSPEDTTVQTEGNVETVETTTENNVTEPTTKQEETVTEPTVDVTEPAPDGDTLVTQYENYQNMSGEEQKAFMESFGSIEAFFEWHNAAKAEYEALHPDIEIDGGSVDLGGGNG